MNVFKIKQALRGQWVNILILLASLRREILDGRHHPCPKCGGKDRFRMVDKQNGALFCNQCFNSQNGDGIAALCWLNGWSFRQTIEQLDRYQNGVDPIPLNSRGQSGLDLISQLALEKSCPPNSLKRYGAMIDMARGAVVFPAYGPDGTQCSTFSIYPGQQGIRSKGLFEKGKPAGLMLPHSRGRNPNTKRAIWRPRLPSTGQQWIICEGVKDAAAYHGLTFHAAGHNSDHLAQKFVPLFRDAHVVIMPDRTTSAEEKAKETAARLASVAASVKIGSLPLPLDGKRGDDVRDALKQKGGEEMVRRAIDTARPYRYQQKMLQPTSEPISTKGAVLTRIGQLENGPAPTVQLGMRQLDRALGEGIPYGSFCVMAALASHGKTAFALQACDHISCVQQVPTAFLSLEMATRQLAERLMSRISDVTKPRWHQQTTTLRSDTEQHYNDAADCEIYDDVQTLEQVCDALKSSFERGVRVAFIDYVQLITVRPGMNQFEAVNEISRALKGLAKDHDVTIVALAQLNKRVLHQRSTDPTLGDIDYGTKLAHDADQVIYLIYPYRINSLKNSPDDYLVILEKNRYGEAKKVIKCAFNPSRQEITEKDGDLLLLESELGETALDENM